MNPITLLIDRIDQMERAIHRDARVIGAMVDGLIAVVKGQRS